MLKVITKIQSYLMSDDGATAIEYGLIAGGISLAIVAAVFAFGDDLEGVFNNIGDAMEKAGDEVETTR
jgi:pilus assembly protein Flp/PilA